MRNARLSENRGKKRYSWPLEDHSSLPFQKGHKREDSPVAQRFCVYPEYGARMQVLRCRPLGKNTKTAPGVVEDGNLPVPVAQKVCHPGVRGKKGDPVPPGELQKEFQRFAPLRRRGERGERGRRSGKLLRIRGDEEPGETMGAGHENVARMLFPGGHRLASLGRSGTDAPSAVRKREKTPLPADDQIVDGSVGSFQDFL